MLHSLDQRLSLSLSLSIVLCTRSELFSQYNLPQFIQVKNFDMDKERDEMPILSDTQPQSLDKHKNSMSDRFSSWSRSASDTGALFQQNRNAGHTGPLISERKIAFVQMSGPLCIRKKPEEPCGPTPGVLGHRGKVQLEDKYSTYDGGPKNGRMQNGIAKKNEHLLKSGQLGMCNDPYCTTCPSDYNYKAAQRKFERTSDIFDTKFDAIYGDAKGCAWRFCSFLQSYIPGVMNPHTKVVQQWNQFFVISCLVAIFVDPLFFFVLTVLEEHKCIAVDRGMAITMVVLRSITDIIYLFHILLQFRLAYVSPESRVVGAGDLVDHPTKIALHYLSGFFMIDMFSVLPIPQVIILSIVSDTLGSPGANYAKNLIRVAILVQYLPRLYRFLPLLVGQSTTGFIFESAWANFVLNLLTYVLCGHVVGSCWYLFGLQRVNQCLRNACHFSGIESCVAFIDCDHGNVRSHYRQMDSENWKRNKNATKCFTSEDGPFDYGVYHRAVNLVTQKTFAPRYVYSLFWGFQQISTLAGNLEPSYFVWEVLFTMAIVGLGLLLFALLIGNMQNFLQSLGRRRLEMSLRRRDVEQWMNHRRLPEELKRRVREAERYSWAATRGVNEEMMMENLPEDIQSEIRRHLFKFVTKVRVFALMEEMDKSILDSICERLRQKTYIKGSMILHRGASIDKMVFIVRGKLQSVGEDNIKAPLSEGEVCGEELLMWCLEHSSAYKGGKKIKTSGQRLQSTRTVTCLTNVEAFALKAIDLKEVTSLYSRILRNPRVQGAIRNVSPYWRSFAARQIQVAWRYRMKRLNRKETANGNKGSCKVTVASIN